MAGQSEARFNAMGQSSIANGATGARQSAQRLSKGGHGFFVPMLREEKIAKVEERFRARRIGNQARTEMRFSRGTVAKSKRAVLSGKSIRLALELPLRGGPLAGGRRVAAIASRLEQAGEAIRGFIRAVALPIGGSVEIGRAHV